MTITDYCLMVQERVLASCPSGRGKQFDEWFGDTGLASNAVGYAIERRNRDAIRVAEKLARKYGLPDCAGGLT